MWFFGKERVQFEWCDLVSPLWPSFLGPSPPRRPGENSELPLVPPSALWTGEVAELARSEGAKRSLPAHPRSAKYQVRLSTDQVVCVSVTDAPGRYASMIVFPGYPNSPDDSEALERFTEIPIAMLVGGDDAGWIGPMTTTLDTLESLGGSVSLEIRDGEGHVMASLSDGVDVFDFLDAQR